MDIPAFFRELDQLFAQQRVDDAHAHLISGLERAEEENDPGAALSICNELIGFFRVRTEFSRAEAYYENALALLRDMDALHSEAHATTLLNAAAMFSAADDTVRAAELFEKAAGIFSAVGSQPYTLAALRNNLASLYLQQGQLVRAGESAETALREIRKLPDCEDEQGVTHTILAQIRFRQGRSESALRELDAAERCFSAAPASPAHRGAMLLTRGEVLGDLGRWELSAAACEEALALTEKVYGRNLSCEKILRVLVRARAALGETDAAEELLRQAEEIRRRFAAAAKN